MKDVSEIDLKEDCCYLIEKSINNAVQYKIITKYLGNNEYLIVESVYLNEAFTYRPRKGHRITPSINSGMADYSMKEISKDEHPEYFL